MSVSCRFSLLFVLLSTSVTFGLQNSSDECIMDSSNKSAQDMKNYGHNAAIEAVSSMNRELQVLYEKYLELGVRSHLLEVDLATQFNPDLVLALEDLNENCNTCSQAVEELMHVSEISEEQTENLDNHMHENV